MWGYVVDADKEEFIRYLNTNGSEKCKFLLNDSFIKECEERVKKD